MLAFVSFPENIDPTTWPAGWVILSIIAFFWALKQLAEALGSIKTIRDNGLGAKDWLKGLIVTPRQQAAQERKELRESMEGLRAECSDIRAQNTEILREVKPNGGKSLRDEMRMMGEQVESTAAWIHHTKETADTPIFILDERGHMEFANCAFRELTNTEQKDLEHLNYLARMEAGDRKRFKDELDMAIESKIPIDFTGHWKLEGPRYVAVRLLLTPNVAHGGVLRRFFCTACKTESPEAMHLSQS